MTVRETQLGAATRDAYGQALKALGGVNPKVVALDSDLSKSTKSGDFAKAFPERFFNVGIAEANMVGMTAGLAGSGLIPFAHSFASFLMAKGFDQLRMGVANPQVNAKFVGSHGGISLGEDGASQQSVEDFALAIALPHFAVLCPADEAATHALVPVMAQHVGPMFMRTGRPKAAKVYAAGDVDFKVGGSRVLQSGTDLTIVACGLMVHEALRAADMAAEKGLSVGVVDAYSLKPLDAATIVAEAKKSGAVLVAEEHLTTGGLGAQVAQALGVGHPVPMAFVGLEDTYAESGTPESLMEKFGLTGEHIWAKAEALLGRKKALVGA